MAIERGKYVPTSAKLPLTCCQIERAGFLRRYREARDGRSHNPVSYSPAEDGRGSP